ncbi:hypothetical protein HZC07_01580 [Candidatus Micrarchaeota archaeon]|nr:hypothetical protein [Candidatus Micrarchaeota archaeon]
MVTKHKEPEALKEQSSDLLVSFFDINQLELAQINHLLDQIEKSKRVTDRRFTNLSRTKRILLIQKYNLEEMCKKLKKETRKGELQKELALILSGEKSLSLSCFLLGGHELKI